MQKSILVIFFLLAFTQQADLLNCISPQGEPVEWWLALKMPKPYGAGKNFLYYDSTMTQDHPEEHQDITSMSGPLMQTLEQIEQTNSGDYSTAFWSDQPYTHESVSSTYAHAKGIMGGNDNSGFIINHSTPRFPEVNDEGKINLNISDNQVKYGQHFFCMSFDSQELNQYGMSMLRNKVFPVKDTFIHDSTLYNYWKLLQEKDWQVKDIMQTTLKMSEGTDIMVFSKFYKIVNDLYQDFVAPRLEDDLIIESWGRPLQTPTCDEKYTVVSNKEISYMGKYEYSYTKDHSKFVLTRNKNIVCFGDVNRMNSQFKRGGGINCINHDKLANFIRESFVEQYECGLSSSQYEQQEEEEISFFENLKNLFFNFYEKMF